MMRRRAYKRRSMRGREGSRASGESRVERGVTGSVGGGGGTTQIAGDAKSKTIPVPVMIVGATNLGSRAHSPIRGGDPGERWGWRERRGQHSRKESEGKWT